MHWELPSHIVSTHSVHLLPATDFPAAHWLSSCSWCWSPPIPAIFWGPQWFPVLLLRLLLFWSPKQWSNYASFSVAPLIISLSCSRCLFDVMPMMITFTLGTGCYSFIHSLFTQSTRISLWPAPYHHDARDQVTEMSMTQSLIKELRVQCSTGERSEFEGPKRCPLF